MDSLNQHMKGNTIEWTILNGQLAYAFAQWDPYGQSIDRVSAVDLRGLTPEDNSLSGPNVPRSNLMYQTTHLKTQPQQ